MTKKKDKLDNPESTQDDDELSPILEVENDEASDAATKVSKLEKQSQEYFEGWQRERADFLNYKKRIEREQISLKNYTTAEIIKKYLVVVDDMELALKNQPGNAECLNWVNGVNLIYQKLISILESEGVVRIPTDGVFDPNLHEALTQIDSDDIESGHVVEVMRNGYRIGERILRPSLVIVAR